VINKCANYSLQKFKLKIANTVVSKENQSFASMNTSQLLDLFNYTGANSSKKRATAATSSTQEGVDALGQVKTESGSGGGLKAMLASLDELWEESAYAEEYNLDSFLKSL